MYISKIFAFSGYRNKMQDGFIKLESKANIQHYSSTKEFAGTNDNSIAEHWSVKSGQMLWVLAHKRLGLQSFE